MVQKRSFLVLLDLKEVHQEVWGSLSWTPVPITINFEACAHCFCCSYPDKNKTSQSGCVTAKHMAARIDSEQTLSFLCSHSSHADHEHAKWLCMHLFLSHQWRWKWRIQHWVWTPPTADSSHSTGSWKLYAPPQGCSPLLMLSERISPGVPVVHSTDWSQVWSATACICPASGTTLSNWTALQQCSLMQTNWLGVCHRPDQ